MEFTFKLTVRANGDFTEDELKDFIAFESGASCQIENSNPFIDEDCDAEVTRVDIE